MRACAFLCAAVGSLLIPAARTLRGDPSKQTGTDRIARLIQQLGDDKFVKREAASKELNAIGMPALKALHQAVTTSKDPEVRVRAQRIAEAVEKRLPFNGKDLTGWITNQGGDLDRWGAEDGVLFTKGAGGGWLMTKREYGDFEIRLEFKLPKEGRGNSGVALRSPLQGDPSSVGMEIQILDDAWYLNEKNYQGLRLTQRTGAIYGVVGPSKDALKLAGEWNMYRIVCKGRQVTITLNGRKIVDANLDDHKEHFKNRPGLLRKKGHLGLQSHDGRVEFRNIFVKPL